MTPNPTLAPTLANAPVGAAGTRPGARRTVPPATVKWPWIRESLDPLRLSLFFIIMVSIGRIHHHVPLLSVIRPGLLGFAVVMLSAMLNPRELNTRVFQQTWAAKGTIVLLVVACLSAVFGISLGGSARFILDEYIRVALVSLVMFMAVGSLAHLKFLVGAYVASCAVWGLYGPTFGTRVAAGATLARMDGTPMFDPNDLGLIILVGLPLALWMFQTSGRLGRLAILATLGGIGYLLAIGGSRGALLGGVLVGGALVVTVKSISLGRKMVGLVLVATALVLAAPPGYWEQMSTMLNPETDYNLTDDLGRVAIAKRGVGYMLSYPVFGVGAGNFGRAEGTMHHRLGSSEQVAWIAPHNTFVQVGAEMGMPALIIWMTLLWAGTMGVWKLRRRIPRSWRKGTPEQVFAYQGTNFLPLAFIAFASTSFFLSFAYLQPFYLLLVFLAALQVHTRRMLREAAGPAPQHSRRGPVRRMPVPTPWATEPQTPDRAEGVHTS